MFSENVINDSLINNRSINVSDECRVYDDYSNCIQASFNGSAQPTCFDYFDYVSRNVFGQFCQSDIRRKLVNDPICFNSLSKSQTLRQCIRELNNTLDFVRSQGNDHQLDYTTLCFAMQAFADCLRQVVASNCSQRNAELVGEFFAKSRKAIFGGFSCSDLANSTQGEDMKLSPPLANLISPPSEKQSSKDVHASTPESVGEENVPKSKFVLVGNRLRVFIRG